MVTRKTRNYRDRKTMTTFGQYILPLTVIMAVALLFFSVKLFFFNSNNMDDIVLNERDASKNETVLKAYEEKVVESIPDPSEKQKVNVKPAQPVNIKKEAPKKENKVTVTPTPKAPVKSSETAKETDVKVENPQATSVTKAARWDIQIGAFTSKENALQLIEKTKAKGYSVYLSEEKKDGSPIYRVRVKNPKTGREEAVGLSNKLEAEGYPIFLVEIK